MATATAAADEADKQRYKITVRFGVELLEDGHTAVPNLVLNHYAKLGMSPAEMMFTIHIWQYWWTEKQPYPSLQAVADKMQVSRRQVRNYAQSLKAKGLLQVHERYAPGLGQVTSEYDFSTLFERILEVARTIRDTPRKEFSEGGRKAISAGPRNDLSPEEDEGKEDQDQENEDHISSERDAEARHNDHWTFIVKKQFRKQSIVDNSAALPAAGPTSNGTPAPTGWSHAGQVLATRPVAPTERRSGGGRGRPPKAPPYLTRVMVEFSQLVLGDTEHVWSNVTRAARLWKASGLSEQAFVQDVLYKARSITQAQGNIKKRAAGDPHQTNRAPYFFAVVEDLLGLREGSAP